MRVKRGTTTHRRHKKILKATKGYIRARRSSFKKAKEAWIKAGTYAYRDRRNKKRDFRQLWNTRINAATRLEGVKYSQFIALCKKHNILLDRKILAYLAVEEPNAMKAIVQFVKSDTTK